MREKFIVGLDIGTTKVCAIVGKVNGRSREIIAYGVSPCSGLRKGIIVDMEATTDAIRAAVSEAESSSGIEIRAAYVGIAGSHIKCTDSFGATGIKNKEITRSDIERVLESASSIYIPLDRDVLHIIPSDFVIDGLDGVVQPIGMSGVRLEVRVNIITAAHSVVENLTKCCERAGIRAVDVVLEPIASAQASLTPDEMQSGVALIDIGGGTTDIAIYKQGRLRHTAVISIGGNHLTNDIAIGLRVSQKEAERVKKAYGNCFYEGDASQEVVITGINGEEKTIPLRYISEILRPRCEELFSLLREEIKEHILFCAVLTGGTSHLIGIDRLAEGVMGLPVRKGNPISIGGAVYESLKNPAYSTSVGLMLYGMDKEAENGLHTELIDKILGILKGIRVSALKQYIKMSVIGIKKL